MKIPIFPGKYHQNGGFSMAMLVYRRVWDLGSENGINKSTFLQQEFQVPKMGKSEKMMCLDGHNFVS